MAGDTVNEAITSEVNERLSEVPAQMRGVCRFCNGPLKQAERPSLPASLRIQARLCVGAQDDGRDPRAFALNIGHLNDQLGQRFQIPRTQHRSAI